MLGASDTARVEELLQELHGSIRGETPGLDIGPLEIRGNRAGLLTMAIHCLEAARGSHHEKLRDSGYPGALKNSEIRLFWSSFERLPTDHRDDMRPKDWASVILWLVVVVAVLGLAILGLVSLLLRI